MELKQHYYPKCITENLGYFNEEENNNFTFISKKHPELQRLSINKQSKYILDLCTGENSTIEILGNMIKKYPDVDQNLIKNDINSILYKLWNLGIVKWNNKTPFDEYFEKNFNKLYCKILYEDEVVNKIKESKFLSFPATFDIDFLHDETNIRQRQYFGLEQYSVIEYNGQEILIGISFKNIKSKTCNLFFYFIGYYRFQNCG